MKKEETVTAKVVKVQGTKYADMIFPDEKSSKNELKLEAVEDAEADIYNTLTSARKAIRTTLKAYTLSKKVVPFNCLYVLECKVKYDNAVKNLEDLEAIQKELF